MLTRSGPVAGVVGRKPIHVLEADERKKAVELKGLHVDIGVRDAEEARALVREGDPIVIADRAGRAARRPARLALARQPPGRVRRARGRPPRQRGRRRRGPVAGVAAVQEEIGSHGARTMAYGLEPDLAVVVDVTHATDAPA